MKRQQIKQLSNSLVNFFYVPLVFISVLGSVQLILTNFQGLSRVGMIVVNFIAFVLLVYVICRPFRQVVNNGWKNILYLIRLHPSVALWILIVVTVVWQIAVVLLISGYNSWDPGIIAMRAMGKRAPGAIPEYFSVNPNVLLLLFLEHGLWLISGQLDFAHFAILLNLINILLVDSAVIMLCIIMKRWFGKTKVKLLVILAWVLIVMSPWIAEPYTDTWAFFLTTVILYFIDRVFSSHNKRNKYVFSFFLGLIIIFAYYMKPPLIITILAAGIILIFKGIEKSKVLFNVKILISICLILVGMGTGFTIYQSILRHQEIVKIDPGRANLPSHFMAIGMHGTGGFYGADGVLNVRIKSPKARNKANIKLIKSRYAGFHGITNYEKFLVRKQINNTADGSFSWGQEGGFLRTNDATNPMLNRTLIRRLFAKNGIAHVNCFEYRFFAQIVWCGLLIGLFGTIGISDWKTQLLKYAMVGFMLFLLLFEGGRSRYMIQFLPVTIMLATVGGSNLLNLIRFKAKKVL